MFHQSSALVLVVSVVSLLGVAACDRSASERPTERTERASASASAANPKPSAGTVSSNDKTDGGGVEGGLH